MLGAAEAGTSSKDGPMDMLNVTGRCDVIRDAALIFLGSRSFLLHLVKYGTQLRHESSGIAARDESGVHEVIDHQAKGSPKGLNSSRGRLERPLQRLIGITVVREGQWCDRLRRPFANLMQVPTLRDLFLQLKSRTGRRVRHENSCAGLYSVLDWQWQSFRR